VQSGEFCEMDMLIKSVHYHETVDYFDILESPTIGRVIQIEMPAKTTEIEKKLWTTADSLRANSRLKASEYSVPVLGLIFLRFADYRFTQVDLERHHFACTPCAMEPCLSEHRNAGARKMTLLPMFRSLSVNQGCVQRDRFLNSLANW
jgi:hypothetical protein